MDRKETLKVINEMIDESTACMKKGAEKILSGDWDFDQFGDRNTFARCIFAALLTNEKAQYAPKETSATRDLISTAKYLL